MKNLRWILFVLFGFVFSTSHMSLQAEPSATIPSGFVDELVTSLGAPTAMKFSPDGRLLIAQRTGQLRVYQSGNLLANPAIDLTSVLCDNTERGLLGIAIDPNFVTNNYIYLYYTFDQFGDQQCRSGSPTSPDASKYPVNRVSRFELPESNIIAPSSEKVILTNILNNTGAHNAGDLHFDMDGLLSISTGDGGAESVPPRQINNINGKILRIQINTDGSYEYTNIGNPYASQAGVRKCGDPAGIPSGTGPCGEIIIHGLRNPFRFVFKPGTNQFYINDNGQNNWDEINEGEIGADYGWNLREGPCTYPSLSCGDTIPPHNTKYPLYTYHHDSGCSSVTGATFVPAGFWPAPYNEAYLYADYVCGKIFRLKLAAQPYTVAQSGTYLHSYEPEVFVDGVGESSIVGLMFGPYQSTQALYYVNYKLNQLGEIRRIRYTGSANRPPVAQFTIDPSRGDPPLLVNFDASGSSDADADPITYDWDFGDGGTSNGNNSPMIQHTYNTTGTFTAKLVVKDNQSNSSNPVSKEIHVGNTPPVAQINMPGVNDFFAVGQTIQLNGSATDAEDGVLASNRLTWEVSQRHIDSSNPSAAHAHPYLPPTTGNNLSVTAPNMEDSYAEGSYLEISLTATDLLSATTTITREWRPAQVEITLASQPEGFTLYLSTDGNGLRRTCEAPCIYTVWNQAPLLINAPITQALQGEVYQFVSWSDSGAISHAISMPSTDTTFTAVYTVAGGPTPTTTATPDESTPASTATPTGTVTPSSTATVSSPMSTQTVSAGVATATMTPIPTGTQPSGGNSSPTPASLSTPASKFSSYLPLVRR